MRLTRRPGFKAFAAGALLLLAAGWLFLWALSSSLLRCAECDCRYSLGASNPACRMPAVLPPLAFVALAGGAAAFVVGWRQWRRSKRKEGSR